MTSLVLRHDGLKTFHGARTGANAIWAVQMTLPPPNACIDPPRFRAVLARQMRQDAWRRLSRHRGLVPAVEVDLSGALTLRLGYTASDRRIPRAHIAERLKDLLEDPATRRRWVVNAERAARC